jgi:hypothetical protein
MLSVVVPWGYAHVCHAIAPITKAAYPKVENSAKQFLGSLPLAFVFPNQSYEYFCCKALKGFWQKLGRFKRNLRIKKFYGIAVWVYKSCRGAEPTQLYKTFLGVMS